MSNWRRLGGPALLGLLSIAWAALGFSIAWHYPLVPPLMAGIFGLFVVCFYCWPSSWLVALPALVPVIGLAPWTGWLTFEELDLLVLAIACAGYARMVKAVPSGGAPLSRTLAAEPRISARMPLSVVILLVIFMASVLVAMLRGFADAGGFEFGWYQGYHEPMNSFRLAKSFLEALLLAPLWRRAVRQQQGKAGDLLVLGLSLGLAGASLGAIWERMAFTDLLNFSSDYRTTSLFWEMHVGGAAFDGFLALTVPVAVHALLSAKSPLRGAWYAAVCALAAYACLTTFSRGVYLGVLVALAVFGALKLKQARQGAGGGALTSAGRQQGFGLLTAALLVVGFGLLAAWVFQAGGYRGSVALLGVAALVLPLGGLLQQIPRSQRYLGAAEGLVLIVIVGGISWLVPKGAYVVYVLLWLATACMVWGLRRRVIHVRSAGAAVIAGYSATAATAAFTAIYWGDMPALVPAVAGAVGGLLLLAAAGAVNRPLWPESARWQSIVLCMMAFTIAVAGVFGGGAYMGERFSTGGRDLEGRLDHWTLGVGMLTSPFDWVLGKGLGRFPANYFLVGDPKDHPGDYRLANQQGKPYLKLTGGLHVNDGWAQVLRVTQRVSEPGAAARAGAMVRAATDTVLLFEVCEKHLLYIGACMNKEVPVKAAPGKWQNVEAQLQGQDVVRGHWFAPNLLAFSVAVGTGGATIDLDQLRLFGSTGRNLLANGDFADGMAHWFFSSDRHHLPWHIKNIFMNVLFDQGLAGLVLIVAMLVTALASLSMGKGKRHPLAPALAASLMGFCAVGLFDSLLDVPRVAFLFYFLLIVGQALGVSKAEPRMAPLQPDPAMLHSVPSAAAPRAHKVRRNRTLLLVLSALVVLTLGLVVLAASLTGRPLVDLVRATPAEILRHAKDALTGYEYLAPVLLPPINQLQERLERPPPKEALPNLGKGQQTQSLPPQQFSAAGVPAPVALSAPVAAVSSNRVTVRTAEQLMQAVEGAQAGAVIELEPGRYRINHAVTTRLGGTPEAPIVVRAADPGAVELEMDTVEGFRVTRAYWIFENLTIRGVCKRDSDCEHAFHVVGEAKGVVLRNNRLEDFNAHIKINGEDGRWPDFGLMQFNTLVNHHARETGNPVTPVDLVAASGWRVADNLISDFAHAGGNKVAYGIFMKGAGKEGRIERNVIVCTTQQISQPGNRIGLSWGGGGSYAGACRDKLCLSEHMGGLASNNVVAHCNDAGIDINRSRQITIAHNTLINTAGINARGHSEEISVYGNLLEGRIRAQAGAGLTQGANEVAALSKLLTDPDRLRLDRRSDAMANMPVNPQVTTDFCGQPRKGITWSGASVPGGLPCKR